MREKRRAFVASRRSFAPSLLRVSHTSLPANLHTSVVVFAPPRLFRGA